MSPLLSLISLALVGMTVGCTSLPAWNGKYTRTDGKFELHSELEADMIEVAIVAMEEAMKADGEQLPEGGLNLARDPMRLGPAADAPAAGA